MFKFVSTNVTHFYVSFECSSVLNELNIAYSWILFFKKVSKRFFLRVLLSLWRRMCRDIVNVQCVMKLVTESPGIKSRVRISIFERLRDILLIVKFSSVLDLEQKTYRSGFDQKIVVKTWRFIKTTHITHFLKRFYMQKWIFNVPMFKLIFLLSVHI